MLQHLRQQLAPFAPGAVLDRRRRRALVPPLVQRLVADPDAALADDAFLRALVAAWGNGGFPAHPDYLRAIAAAVRGAGGDVLECGCGLSTLVLAAVARGARVRVWSLEHLPAWRREVNAALAAHGLDASAAVLDAPLCPYAGYSWYRVPAGLPSCFPVVVCDGPPRRTPGGRYGLVPVMRPRLGGGATIVVDDAARAGEQAALKRWAAETGGAYEECGGEKPYAVFTLPPTA